MAFLNETGLTRYDGKLKNLMAAAYSTSATYAVGDYCIHGGSLYRCTSAIESAEAWTAGHWTKVNLGDEIDSAKEDIAKLKLDVADAFSAADSHEVGDYVVKDGVLYRCTTAIGSGGETWTPGHWTAVNIGDELVAVKADIGILKSDLADAYDSTATYAVGDYCLKDGVLYRCTTAISTAEAWTAGHWTAAQVGDELGDLKGAITSVQNIIGSSNAGFHNSVFRGKYLGSSYTTDQHNAIVAGTFDDLYIGDYWTIGGIDYVICHFDYYYRCSDVDINYHHIVVMPRGVMTGLSVTKTSAETSDGYYQWNETNTTSGGYIASRMRTVIMPACDTKVKAAFDSSYVKTISELYPTSHDSTSGRATGWGWTSTDLACDLCNETMVYGAQVWSISNDGRPGYEVGFDKWQLAIFRLYPAFATMDGDRAAWWLRSVTSATGVAFVSTGGIASDYSASAAYGVRPRFLLS